MHCVGRKSLLLGAGHKGLWGSATSRPRATNILTLALDKGERPASHSSHTAIRESVLSFHSAEGFEVPKHNQHVLLNSCLCRALKLSHSAKTWSLCEISGSHGNEYEDDSLLGYSAMQSH
jgi:hypothetical protein